MKRLSTVAAFRNSLVLRAKYDSNPCMSGECEIGVKFLKTKVGVWEWNDEWGAEEVLSLPFNSTWHDVVRVAAAHDEVVASVHLDDITIFQDQPPFGQMLALAWAEDGEHKQAVALLLHLCDATLIQLSKHGTGLRSTEVLGMLNVVNRALEDLGVEADELAHDLQPQGYDVTSVKAFLLAHGIAVAQSEAERQAHIDAVLEPFLSAMEAIEIEWAKDKPRSRYPGSGSMIPPFGLVRLHRYLREYVLAHVSLPSGVHTIPPGLDTFNRVGAALSINFDALRGVTK